jgi:hypothetical protein
MAFYFSSYEQWREAYGARCGIKLTPEYCRERIRALNDPNEPSTAEFVKCYGKDYLRQVVQWFERAEQTG